MSDRNKLVSLGRVLVNDLNGNVITSYHVIKPSLSALHADETKQLPFPYKINEAIICKVEQMVTKK